MNYKNNNTTIIVESGSGMSVSNVKLKNNQELQIKLNTTGGDEMSFEAKQTLNNKLSESTTTPN
ncbi:MAG: hypothetical protein Q8N88_04340 [Nanoarchaeota archaeon]|nr:hypothetical protein [Nanoarchaeota archaeon]